jgi:hypothetical protein
MTENNKPEWFEIAENDGPAAPPKASKALPMLAVFGAALIIGVGAVVAQVQEKSPVDPVASNPAQTASASNSSSPESGTPNAMATSGLKNPSIAQLPTKGDDDDDDDDDEGEDDDEDEDDDDDEGEDDDDDEDEDDDDDEDEDD